MVKRTVKRTRKVNVRHLYNAGGYTGDYARFIRDKVVPIVGDTSLHLIASEEGSRVREYSVTSRNFTRLVKALDVDMKTYEHLNSIKKAVEKAGSKTTAELILKLISATPQPLKSKDYPVAFRIPIHPISHNQLYIPFRGTLKKSELYKKFRIEFFKMVREVIQKEEVLKLVDLTKPLEVLYKFGHREKSVQGGVFDRSNFQKAAQDCVFEFLGHDDSKVLNSSISGEFVGEYSQGYIELKIRNI